jgi:hypothetical protein
MSILQEYEQIRKVIGEEKYQRIKAYLDKHPDMLLSDVYYKEGVFDAFEGWEKETYGDVIPPPERYGDILCGDCGAEIGLEQGPEKKIYDNADVCLVCGKNKCKKCIGPDHICYRCKQKEAAAE